VLRGWRLSRGSGKTYNKHYLFYDNKRLWTTELALIIGLVSSIYYSSIYYFIKYANNSYSCIRSIYGLYVGDFVGSLGFLVKNVLDIRVGCRIPIRELFVTSIISCISTQTYGASKISTASGTYCTILEINNELSLALIELPTKKKIVRWF